MIHMRVVHESMNALVPSWMNLFSLLEMQGHTEAASLVCISHHSHQIEEKMLKFTWHLQEPGGEVVLFLLWPRKRLKI
jgi:hypothetical protein